MSTDQLQAALSVRLHAGIGAVKAKQAFEQAGSWTEAANLLHVKQAQRDQARNLLDLSAHLSLRATYFGAEDYPAALSEVYDPPVVLFYKSRLDLAAISKHRVVSIVGTRKATKLGLELTRQIASTLSSRGIVVASGMALGIDRAAHEGAIMAGGKPLAVMPSSADKPVPWSNKDVYQQVYEAGWIISETYPGEDEFAGMFPRRNRIIAGIAETTIVIEAAQKSGALITATQAVDYGREVLAVPGAPGASQSVGTNNLIKQNKAQLVDSVEEVLLALGLANIEQPLARDFSNLPAELVPIAQTLQASAMHLEEIVGKFDISQGRALSLLAQLEVLGVVYVAENGRYSVIA